MIRLTEVLAIHDILIERFGGAKGVRDNAGLESAINRPYQTFDGKELYPDPVAKAASISFVPHLPSPPDRATTYT